jgi:hypothetical protein
MTSKQIAHQIIEQQLQTALSTDLNAPHWQLIFRTQDLEYCACLGRNNRNTTEVRPILDCLSAIYHDLSAIGWLIKRIFDQQKGYIADAWFMEKMHYLALDIEMFHVKMLLILDCFSQAFAYTSPGIFLTRSSDKEPEPRSINEMNFTDLNKKWKEGKTLSSEIPQEAFKTLFKCSWGRQLAEVRNIMVHRPKITMALPNTDRVTFGVWERAAPFKKPVFWEKYPELLHNENAVYFDNYAGVYLCQLFAYLQELAPYLLNWFGKTEFPPTTGDAIPLAMMRQCMQRALDDIQSKAGLPAETQPSSEIVI